LQLVVTVVLTGLQNVEQTFTVSETWVAFLATGDELLCACRIWMGKPEERSVANMGLYGKMPAP
jgi:hypothetical protein